MHTKICYTQLNAEVEWAKTEKYSLKFQEEQKFVNQILSLNTLLWDLYFLTAFSTSFPP